MTFTASMILYMPFSLTETGRNVASKLRSFALPYEIYSPDIKIACIDRNNTMKKCKIMESGNCRYFWYK